MAAGTPIVMMTDFGTEHWYDAAMRGEILRRVPDASILDLTHEVPRHSIECAAFLLHCAVDSFPPQTIFCCVIDPGVGSDRRSLVGWVGKYGFVGPDNGIVTPLLERTGDNDVELHEIKSSIFQNPDVSATFHGRDVFAPAAARLLLGDDPRMAGRRVTDPIRLPSIAAVEVGGRIEGKVMLVDHFGNAVTNIEQRIYGERMAGKKIELTAKSLTLDRVDVNYSQKDPNEPLCYWGSSGYLEIAVNFGSAAETYGIGIGDPAIVTFQP